MIDNLTGRVKLPSEDNLTGEQRKRWAREPTTHQPGSTARTQATLEIFNTLFRPEWAPPSNTRHLQPDYSLPAVTHAGTEMNRMATTGAPIDDFTRREVLLFLTKVTQHDTVYPTIAPDEDGAAIAQWNAGERTIVIQFDYTGPLFIRTRTESGQVHTSTLPSEIRDIAQEALSEMSSEVNARNPDWRSLFPV